MRRIFTLLIIFIGGWIGAKAQVSCAFTTDKLNGCPSLVVAFTDQSTGGVTSHFWDFDGAGTSTNTNPTATFVNPGIYNVKHVVSNGTSSDSCFQQIRVFLPAAPNFTAPNPNGCAQPCHSVNFINQTILGESNVQQYVWDFGDGSLPQSGFNVTHCFSNVGSFNITLVALDSNGCQTSIIKPNFITVGNPPDITNITASPTQSCVSPQLVNFTSTVSTPNGNPSYCWVFNGTSCGSSLPNPGQVFFAGLHQPYLVLTDGFGCTDTAFTNVSVTPVNAGFTVSNANACTNIPIQFTDTSNFASSWVWNFGDGTPNSTQQNPSHVYAANGTYTITLTVTYNGCTDTETKVAFINVTTPVPVTFTSPDTSACAAPLSVNFASNAPGATSYNWTFGDGSPASTVANPSHTYTANGSYNVTLSVTNAAGCVSTATRSAYIKIGSLNATFSVDSPQGCTPHLVNFAPQVTSNSPVVSYQWNFGNGNTSTLQNPSTIYTTTGLYVPTLIVTNADGCVDSVSYSGNIEIGQTLNPSFSAIPLVQCINQQVAFTNLTAGVSAQTTYLWEFGDGQTSGLQNPNHAYTDTGFYDISLTVINQGCRSTLTFIEYIQIVVPKADFYFQFDCNNPTTVTFNDTSQGAHTWFWDFGDGTTSTTQSPTHTFPAQSNYTVTLVVVNNTTGCVDSLKKTLPIGQPNAGFRADTLVGCAPFTVSFTDTSTFASSWSWSFGDGGTSSQQNPKRTYADTGLYTVRLVINPGATCTDSIIKTSYIRVNGAKAGFNLLPGISGCIPFTPTVVNTSTAYNGTIISYLWTSGIGDSSMIATPSFTYPTTGSSVMRLRVTDSNGCTSTVQRTVTRVNNAARFISDTVVCPGEPVKFTNQSTASNSYLWLFGDGTTSTQNNPSHTYTNSGTYGVTLIANNTTLGCSDTLFVPNLVDVDTPSADFYVTTNFSPCPPFPVQFYNTTNRFDLNWLWYFGDGDTSTARDPLHVYFTPGDFDVTLIAWDSSGCVDTITYVALIRVRGPIGNFIATPDSGCVPLTVSITGSVFSTISIVADLGDGNSFQDTIALTHTYDEVGTFYPVYTLTDSLGCTVSYPVDTIVVGLIPYPNLPADTTVCKGNYVSFNLPYGDTFLWEANQSPKYLTCDTCQNTFATVPDTITYYVTAITNIGCVARDTITVNVDALPQIAPGVSFRICPGDTLQLNAGPNVQAAIWEPNIFIDDSNAVSPKVWPPDSMIYRVTGSNSTGCSISRIVRVWVIDKVEASVNITDTVLCDGNSLQLDVSVFAASINDTSFRWVPKVYLTSDTIPNPVFDAPFGNYTYHVIVSSSTCTPDTDIVNIQVAPIPSLETGDNQTITPGTTLQVWGSSPNQVTYQWQPSVDPLTCYDCRRPYITANQSQTLYVVATNQYGCSAIDSVVLRVIACDPDLVFIPNTFTPNGDGLNDLLYVRGIGLRRLEYFRIFDRWGGLVFETNELNTPWDGNINGKQADLATYVYVVKGECSNGETIQKSGNITLVR